MEVTHLELKETIQWRIRILNKTLKMELTPEQRVFYIGMKEGLRVALSYMRPLNKKQKRRAKACTRQ